MQVNLFLQFTTFQIKISSKIEDIVLLRMSNTDFN